MEALFTSPQNQLENRYEQLEEPTYTLSNFKVHKYRVILFARTLYTSANSGNIERVSNAYDFIGEITKSTTTHSFNGISNTSETIMKYDHADRITKVTYQLNEGPVVTLNE